MTETWKPLGPLGFSSYEVSDQGRVRSIDRVVNGRRLTGRVLSTRVSNRGYVLVNLTDDAGKPATRTVHTVVLGAFAGPCPDGQQARHLNDDPLDNRWPGNLAYGTPAENNADKVRNGNRAPTPPPRPPRTCVRCGEPFNGNGRRCHACVVMIGVTAAQLLSAGTTLADAMTALDYPSAEGLHKLAVTYGGYGLHSRRSWWQRVTATVRDWLQGR